MLLSLTLFLTVSFHSSPYYTGADIVFFFAWIPLLLSGSGGVLSLDAAIAARVAAERQVGPRTMVPVLFELVQQVCGNYARDTCTAQAGRRCTPVGCPFLTDERATVKARGATRSIAGPSSSAVQPWPRPPSSAASPPGPRPGSGG